MVPKLCCDSSPEVIFCNQDTGVGERLGKGVIHLHLQKGVLNYIAQGQTNRITQRYNISKAKKLYLFLTCNEHV